VGSRGARRSPVGRDTARIFTEEHDGSGTLVARFVADEVVPHHEQWERDGMVPRELWKKAGALGLLCTDVPTEYGGGGVPDFRYNVIVTEELAKVGASGVGFPLHNDVIVPYFLAHATEEQQQRWFPPMASGELITAIAMTEPGTGSDLASMTTTAIRQDDGSYLLNGAKTFITNGIQADLVIVCAKTDPASKHGGISLLVVERGMEGFERGRKLDKIGMHAQDTAELFFDRRPGPGREPARRGGAGLPLPDAGPAPGAARDRGRGHRRRQGRARRDAGLLQGARGVRPTDRLVPELALHPGRDAHQDHDRPAVRRPVHELHNDGSSPSTRPRWPSGGLTDLLGEVVDAGVQLHGGYGYMREYPIARAYVDARVQRIYGGTNEIMKEIIGRTLGV
jgi:alkylation response protein AidB-like acyl-CoA dehydrogenase